MAPCGSCASDKRELQATQSLKMILAVTWTLKDSILAFSVLVWMCSLYFLLIHFNELASFSIISAKCLITKRIKRWREERKALTGRESWGVGWAMRNVCRGWRANGAAVAADRSLLHQLLAGGGSYQAGSSIFTDCLKKNAIKWWPKIWGFVVTRWREWELRRRMKERSGRSCSTGGCQRKACGAAETGSKLPPLRCRRVTGPAAGWEPSTHGAEPRHAHHGAAWIAPCLETHTCG